MMQHIGNLMALAVGFSLPMAASAQTETASAADARYCAALTHLYRAYVNNPEDPRPAQISPSAEYEGAIARCQAGDTAAGIPPLERALKNAKVDLPAHG